MRDDGCGCWRDRLGLDPGTSLSHGHSPARLIQSYTVRQSLRDASRNEQLLLLTAEDTDSEKMLRLTGGHGIAGRG